MQPYMACVAVHDGHLYSCMVCCCGFVTDSVGGDGWTHMVKLCSVAGVDVVVVGAVVVVVAVVVGVGGGSLAGCCNSVSSM